MLRDVIFNNKMNICILIEYPLYFLENFASPTTTAVLFRAYSLDDIF